MKILEKLTIKNTTFKNRVMFPPLTTGYEEKDGSIGEQSYNFYTRLAKGGVGYIVLGDVAPIRTFSPTPKLYDDLQIPTFKKLADGIHQYGGKLGIQIFHPEYDTDALFKLFAEKKFAEVRSKLHHDMLHFSNEVSKEKLDSILTKIGQCAYRAQKANIDVIEIHGDRLVGSLCSPIINKRSDEYGGSFENRIRFALQVVAVIKKSAPNLLIEYKLPIITKQKDDSLIGKGGLYLQEAVKFAIELEKVGVDMIHIGQANHTGNMNDTIPAMGTRNYGFMLDEAKAIRKAVKLPISTVGRMTSGLFAETLLEQGIIDMVGFGRSLLTDPDIVNKLEKGQGNEIRECIMCNKGCTDEIQKSHFISCILNAENGYEGKRSISKTNSPKNVAVIGAGVAGLEATRVLLEKGHHVDLYEKTFKIGGQIIIASVPPRKEEMLRILNYYEEILKNKENLNIYLGKEFTKEDAKKYKDIIVAIGAKNLVPNIEGINNVNVVSSWDVLANKVIVTGKVAVCGGGLVGVETAEYLANKGLDITIIEMQDKIAQQESNTILPTMMKDLENHHVIIKTRAKIKKFELDGVIVENLDENKNVISQDKIEADFIVNALSSTKNRIDLLDIDANIVYIGDAKQQGPSNINDAIKTAYDAANSIN